MRRVFTDAELAFLDSVRHGRLTTIGRDGTPQIHPVSFVVDALVGTLEIGSRRLRDTDKYRNVRRDPRVTLVVDDPALPLRGSTELDEFDARAVEIHGFAELVERSGIDVLRIRPVRIEAWNLDDLGHHGRFTS